ncbi:hypothetical protein GCM10011581_01900 [Saccharopolyspora subtropica]|uniref:DUF3558 domain-containing protein n=1 Tax=Saccharopolyspora thermophila TaxID=89367 RepID=A0A917JK58_9PSEU|nr:DUF3558 domain-containing protein [Saccharopolyspora subtropica]GGI68582.1 hypothetical protein GCM10011581_01900 [Saccharopolyspora subtropica]
MLRRANLTAIAALAVLAAAGCSVPNSSGQNPPSSAASEPTSSSSNPAAKVDKPKNLASITDACQVLTQEQLTTLNAVNAKAPEPGSSPNGHPMCQWSNDNFGLIVGVDNTTGLGTGYIVEKAESSNAELRNIDGYPAVRMDETNLLCRVEVGVSDKEHIAVDFTRHSDAVPEMQDSCGYAEKIASEVLKNLPDA